MTLPISNQRRSRKLGIGLAFIALAGSGVVYQPWNFLFLEPARAESQARVVARKVSVERPQPATTSTIVLPATVRPWQSTTLYARVTGYLKEWHRDLGESVKAGELLAELDTPELDQELAEARSLVSEANAAVAQAKAERGEAEADLKVAEAQLTRVQAQIELAKGQLVRREKLLITRAVSQEEYDTFRQEVDVRAAEVTAAQSEIIRRRANLETRAAIIASREATANSRQANVERLQELQNFKGIVAPFDGVITQRSAEVGMLVTPAKEPLFVVEDIHRVRVQIDVPQAFAPQTVAGTPAIITLPESTVAPVSEMITRVTNSVDAANRTMRAEIELANSYSQFQAGSYAQVTLTLLQNNTAWTIPTNTIQMRVDGPHVVLVNSEDQVEVKAVTLGRDLGARVVVTDGIRGDEQLVVNPSDDLVDGLRIEINARRQPVENVAQH